MGNTAILTKLISPGQSSGVINDVDTLTAALMSLFQTYIPGLPAIRGLHNIGVGDQDRAPVPCIMVQPENVSPTMETSARFTKWYQFHLVWVVGADSIEQATALATDGGVLVQKLFSNNALNDRNTATPSNQFMVYPSNWLDSKMGAIEYEPAFLSGRTPGPKYFAYGEMHLRLQTVPQLM